MKGETVLSGEERDQLKTYMMHNKVKACRQDLILEDLCWALEDIYQYHFRDYMHMGIANPQLHYMSEKYKPLNNFRLMYDREIDDRVTAYAYFDYPVLHAPLYLSITDADRFVPSQMFRALGEVLESYGGYYKTTKKDYYPFTIKIYLDDVIPDEEEDGDLTKILRESRVSQRDKSAVDSLRFIDEYTRCPLFTPEDYEDLLAGFHDAPYKLFEVIDTETFKESEIRHFMKNYKNDLNSLK